MDRCVRQYVYPTRAGSSCLFHASIRARSPVRAKAMFQPSMASGVTGIKGERWLPLDSFRVRVPGFFAAFERGQLVMQAGDHFTDACLGEAL